MTDRSTSQHQGNTVASMLKCEEVGGLVGKDSNIEHYLFERYKKVSLDWKHRFYYRVKPLLPDRLRPGMRKRYARVQARTGFPGWPIEDVLTNMVWDHLKGAIALSEDQAAHWISPWPERARMAFCITHDVELEAGLRNAGSLAAIERELGLRSSWNIVPERYRIDWDIVEGLRADGFEVGVHGLRHDGSLFRSERNFRSLVPRVNAYLQAWHAAGFRSESTLRNADWMPALAADYDSSFPDTDPFEPMPGGCCSVWPYFLGGMVELPMTMPQDHTLFDVLGQRDIALWQRKADWIEENLGMVLLDVHPDYMTTPDRIELYKRFLLFMKSKKSVWHALPRDVARWWRDRDASVLEREGENYRVEGPASARATIMRASLVDGQLRHDVLS